jgi:transmembrane sensor
MDPASPNMLNAQIYEEAARWFVEFRTGDVKITNRAKFTAWLRMSPQHLRAYLELAAIWNEGAQLDPDHQFDPDELAEHVLGEASIIPLEPRSAANAEVIPPSTSGSGLFPGHKRRGHISRFQRPLRLFALAAAVLIAIVGAWAYGERNTYSTGIGEQRSLTLADGSLIELNAQSKIRVRFTADRRAIELVEGQALFHVAEGKARPFVVESSDTTVRAVGTEFDVYRRATGTTVTVLEGRVAILPPLSRSEGTEGSTLPGFLLDAGEQAILSAQATVKPKQPKIAAATAWTQHRLVFDSATLAEVAQEFNRYNQHRLVIRSPELEALRITGAFASTDPGALIRFLRGRPEIVVIEKEDEILITWKVQ